MLIATYRITDPERYAQHNPGSVPVITRTIERHGGTFVFAPAPQMTSGDERDVAIGIEFPDAASVQAWAADPDYAMVAAHRIESTSDTLSFIDDLP